MREGVRERDVDRDYDGDGSHDLDRARDVGLSAPLGLRKLSSSFSALCGCQLGNRRICVHRFDARVSIRAHGSGHLRHSAII